MPTTTPPDPTAALHAALSAFQAEMPTVHKDKTARIPGRNGGAGYEYTYADLGAVSAAAMPLLSKHGLAFSTCPRVNAAGTYEIAGVLLHKDGGRLEGALPLRGNTPQEVGSALTYARRYLLGCMTGIVTDDDDDAQAAQGASATRGWDGPSTAQLLNQIDADGQRVGVDYVEVTRKFREQHRIPDDNLEALEALDPWVVQPFADAVRAHAEKVSAERAAAERSAEPRTGHEERGERDGGGE